MELQKNIIMDCLDQRLLFLKKKKFLDYIKGKEFFIIQSLLNQTIFFSFFNISKRFGASVLREGIYAGFSKLDI